MASVKIGLQGGVMGWDDPYMPELCKQYFRTGERQWFPSQDPTPTAAQQNEILETLGADFFVWCTFPQEGCVERFLAQAPHMPVMLNNEYGNINRIWEPGTNRYDIPCTTTDPKICGMVYDETAHLQLHRDIYGNEADHGRHQWADPDGKPFLQIEREIAAAAGQVAAQYAPRPVYGEYVFPILHHTLARGGIHPCPKLLKEEFFPIQIATAQGAAMQYRRNLGICVDLWGQDVGSWFTRIWGFPAHGPEEFASALRLAYYLAPNLMYVENIDALLHFSGGAFRITEFGDVFQQFKRDFVATTEIPYTHREFLPEIVIVRGDEVTVADTGNLDGSGPYGQRSGQATLDTSAYEAFQLVTNGVAPANGLTYFLPQFDTPHGAFPRTQSSLSELPLLHGVPYTTSVHRLFVPMKSTAVLDRYAVVDQICQPKLVILCNTELTEPCKASIDRLTQSGAFCIATQSAAAQFPHGGNCKNWAVCEHLNEENAKAAAEPYLKNEGVFEMRYQSHTLRVFPTDDTGNRLAFTVTERV